MATAIIRGMDACFGRRFRDQWAGSETWKAAMIEWAQSCEHFGLPAIESAFKIIKAQRLDWPPSLPVFLGLLADTTAKPAHQPYVALPKPQTDREKVAAALAEMREALR